MTELKTFNCNRCGKDFAVSVEEKQAKLTVQHPYANDPSETMDLCIDCYTAFLLFVDSVEAFDKLADKISAKQQKEEETSE